MVNSPAFSRVNGDFFNLVQVQAVTATLRLHGLRPGRRNDLGVETPRLSVVPAGTLPNSTRSTQH